MSCRQSTKIPDLFLLPRAEFGMEMAPRENGKEAGAQYFATSLPCLFATGQSGRQNFRAGRDLRDHIVHPSPAPGVQIQCQEFVSFIFIHSAPKTLPGT